MKNDDLQRFRYKEIVLSNRQAVLIVDDELSVLEVLDARLTAYGYRVYKANNGRDALKILNSRRIHMVVSDVKMPGMGGMELLSRIRDLRPELPVLFLTAYGTIPDAVKAVKDGAVDYITKPFDGKSLTLKIERILNRAKESPPKDLPEQKAGSELVDSAKSPEMKKLYQLVEKVAQSNVNVMILGESGVGKERIANLVHNTGSRKDKPLVVVDCGATPAGLLESELFGHKKGSFTHAVNDKKGLIETADKGTLFLDEIGNISHEMQIRLLRFIEDRKIRQIGGLKEKPVDCRIIAATNADLVSEIKEGRFREDLYFRLRVVTLNIPPLRDRKEDIPLLARQFADAYCKEHGVAAVDIPDETVDWLCTYPWPGNVRELKNAIEAGIVLCADSVLTPDDFQIESLSEPLDAGGGEADGFSLEDSEKSTILRALKKAGGVQKDAAELLGISRRAIHYKVKKYNIDASSLKPKT